MVEFGPTAEFHEASGNILYWCIDENAFLQQRLHEQLADAKSIPKESSNTVEQQKDALVKVAATQTILIVLDGELTHSVSLVYLIFSHLTAWITKDIWDSQVIV